VDDALTHDREYTEAELWENYEYFLEELLPVAEDAGVRMCLHPNDPPVETLGGIPQLFRNFENFRRAMELVPSDNHGLEFCLGCWSEMGADLAMVIDFFGSRDELFYVHFRDVTGAVPSFHEAFVDEGNYDTHEVMGRLREVGFDGMLIPDHVPEWRETPTGATAAGPTRWATSSRPSRARLVEKSSPAESRRRSRSGLEPRTCLSRKRVPTAGSDAGMSQTGTCGRTCSTRGTFTGRRQRAVRTRSSTWAPPRLRTRTRAMMYESNVMSTYLCLRP